MSAQSQAFVTHSVTEATDQTSSLQQAERALWRRLQESEALAAIGRALNETLELERILQLIVESAHHIIPQLERAIIHLLEAHPCKIARNASARSA